MGSLAALSLNEKTSYQRIPFGKEMLKEFLFDPNFKNMNHGSFGTFPVAIRNKARAFQDQMECQPDPFIRYTYPKLLDESREAVAKLLNAPTSTVVFVPNATTGVNTVLRNLVWSRDGRDEILHFNTIYGACGKSVIFTCEASGDLAKGRQISLTYPIQDKDLVERLKNAIQESRADGHRPRIAIFDAISSLPGVRVPFEALTAACREEGILSLIDAAHGVGHIELDLTALDPDFLVSNCHKWLYVPRGCAILYVPSRNQALIRSTIPTSHGYIPRPTDASFENPLPPNPKGSFVANFEFVGTMDNTPYLCVPEAIKWREEAAGGEIAIREYCTKLARLGGEKIAEILGTEILDNEAGSLTNCCMINVRLPLVISDESNIGEYSVKPGFGNQATNWLLETSIAEYHTFLNIFFFQDRWWARFSGQIYLEISDFEWAANVLKEVCERVGKGEYLAAADRVGKKE